MADPYVYEGTNILKNVLEINSQDQLDEYENTVVNLSLIKLLMDGYSIKHTNDIYEIHRRLFSNVYHWAGKPRTINIEKPEIVLDGLSVIYVSSSKIRDEINKLHNDYFNKEWEKYSLSSVVHELSRYVGALWKIHPFREGNTRTLSTYMVFFLKKQGYKLDESVLRQHAAYFRNALVMASLGEYSEYDYLEEILKDAIIHKSKADITPKKNSSKYKKIKGVKMEDYKYNYHQEKEE